MKTKPCAWGETGRLKGVFEVLEGLGAQSGSLFRTFYVRRYDFLCVTKYDATDRVMTSEEYAGMAVSPVFIGILADSRVFCRQIAGVRMLYFRDG